MKTTPLSLGSCICTFGFQTENLISLAPSVSLSGETQFKQKYTQAALVVKNPPACKRCRKLRFDPWVRKIPWKRAWQTTPVLLPGKSHGQGAWWAAVHGVAKSRTQLRNFTFTFHFQALEKEMAAHSSVLAWRVPGTAEPGGLPSMGSRTTDVT